MQVIENARFEDIQLGDYVTFINTGIIEEIDWHDDSVKFRNGRWVFSDEVTSIQIERISSAEKALEAAQKAIEKYNKLSGSKAKLELCEAK